MGQAGEDRGFGTPSSRPGRDDAQLLLAAHVHALRHMPYADLRRRAGGRPQEEEVQTLSGATLRRRTRITTRRGGLRILVQVDDGTRAGRLDPLAEETLVLDADGEMAGEDALASERDDARHRALPTPWVPAVMIGVLVVVVALALLVALAT